MPYRSYTFCFHCICFPRSVFVSVGETISWFWVFKPNSQRTVFLADISTQQYTSIQQMLVHRKSSNVEEWNKYTWARERKRASNFLLLHLHRKIWLIQCSLLCLNVHLFNMPSTRTLFPPRYSTQTPSFDKMSILQQLTRFAICAQRQPVQCKICELWKERQQGWGHCFIPVLWGQVDSKHHLNFSRGAHSFFFDLHNSSLYFPYRPSL